MGGWRAGRPFRDRAEAGRVLAGRLSGLPLRDPVVLALPRGGVVVGAEIAEALHAPLDLLLVRKLGVPDQPELAMGAVGEGEEAIVLNPEVIRLAGVGEGEIAEAVARERGEIARRREAYLAGRARVPVTGRSAIVVDDGIATGATMRAGLAVLRRALPARDRGRRAGRAARHGPGAGGRGRPGGRRPGVVPPLRHRRPLRGLPPARGRGGDRHPRPLRPALLSRLLSRLRPRRDRRDRRRARAGPEPGRRLRRRGRSARRP
ncbi:MAG: phosphoribosyltransferase family protein [Acetobacteraceae bacterium]|nr:phosphoribosyltransferase family protein [Acetobacteraceae bacterium]